MAEFKFAPPYELPVYPFTPPPELQGGQAQRYPIVIVGAGPAGLTLACDLAQRGVRSVLIDDDQTVGVRGASSRGICYAQKTLELMDRLGIGDRIVEKGVAWSFGRTFSGDEEVYSFNLQNQSVSRQPPFVNLQQFYIEWFLVDRIQALGLTDLRWLSRVSDVQQQTDHVVLQVQTPEGSYRLEADHLIDATGANSPIRQQLGLETHASRSTDRWCITDVRFKKPLPVERWTWVDAPFNNGRAVWQHLMADDVWRMDYQMSEEMDPEVISRPDVAGERIRAQLGDDVEFEFVWIGPYQYRDHLLDHFRHGRVLFIGDSAHVVSPFGARGGNTGIQDAFNLGWKLALVTSGQAPEGLLESYSAERQPAAADNLRVTSRSARFLAPRSHAEQVLRRAVLKLAHRHAFARPLVNTGRMSVANDYPESPWLPQGARTVQNLTLQDAAGQGHGLMDLLRTGTRFVGLWFSPSPDEAQRACRELAAWPLDLLAIGHSEVLPDRKDPEGVLARHLGLDPAACAGTLCLIRPDAYLAFTIPACTAAQLQQAIQTALFAAATP